MTNVSNDETRIWTEDRLGSPDGDALSILELLGVPFLDDLVWIRVLLGGSPDCSLDRLFLFHGCPSGLWLREYLWPLDRDERRCCLVAIIVVRCFSFLRSAETAAEVWLLPRESPYSIYEGQIRCDPESRKKDHCYYSW